MLGRPTPPKSGSNRRRYPRAGLRVKATLSVGDQKGRQFEATLTTRDVSISGIFFESTFFLKLGQQVDVELTLPPSDRKVRAHGRIIRVETRDERGRSAGGFAVRFEEYFDSSDVVLANYFMSEVLRKFVEDYAKKRKLRFAAAEMDALVDVLASWELSRSLNDVHPWETQPRG
jgi:hypothetical protein